MRKYRSSDRTHVAPTKWTKKERAEWNAQSREGAERVMIHLKNGNYRNALAVLLHGERLEAHDITTSEHINARRAFFNFVSSLESK